MAFLAALFFSSFVQAAEFKMTFTEFRGDSTFAVLGRENLTAQFYCPAYNAVLIYGNDGRKLFDFKASNCEEVKNYISLVLLSGGKVQATFDQVKSVFKTYGVSGTDSPLCMNK